MRSVTELDVKGKAVFLRVDFNVPLDDNSRIRDDMKIRSSLPTIRNLLDRGARLVICSHLGRPKGKVDPQLSLKPVAASLASLVPFKIHMAPEVIGPEVSRLKAGLGDGEALLLENVRFHKEEEENGSAFAEKLAEGINIFVNDAFGACHRSHASVVGIAAFVGTKAAGFLLKKEVNYLKMIVDSPDKPYVAILGGAKVSGKIEIIESLLDKADHLLIGGAMANTFLKAQGLGIGKSRAEDDQKDVVLSIMDKARAKNVEILLPVDYLIATAVDASAETKTVESLPLPEDWMAVDIGPKTVERFARVINEAGTVFWNGPMGIFEIEPFSGGTVGVARAVAASGSISIVGGGDSVAAVKKAGVKQGITHLSTGGGASLEFVAYGSLPGIDVLET